MLTSEDRRCLATLAAEEGIEPAALEAVVEVESGGRIFARIAGRDEPLIRWEGHYFDRLCKPSVRERACRAGLASPRAGAVANPPTQAGRWTLLRRAALLDHDAAYQSVSWGVGQVMGAHWQALGYADVDALVAEARSGLAGQARLMIRFIVHADLDDALARRDWSGFARGYNGPAYERSGYDAKIATAYRACKAGSLLRCGDAGEDVAALQRGLAACGQTVSADGVFGLRTETAVRAFQAECGLDADGIAGPRTLAALAAKTEAA